MHSIDGQFAKIIFFSDYEDEPSTSGIMSAMSTASLPVTAGVSANRFFGPEFSIDRSKFI